jgi:hypothetical protein
MTVVDRLTVPHALRALAVVAFLAGAGVARADHRSAEFAGPKADRGTVVHSVEDGRHVLTLSDDFKIPDAPDPHWRVVDAKGEAHLLDRLTVKPGQTLRRSIVLPRSITSLATVQMYCAWAETVLGEASFPQAIAMKAPREPGH